MDKIKGAAGFETRILSPQEVFNLNKDGFDVRTEESKLYIQAFLLNDQQNHAGDPSPFKVKGASLKKIAQTAIGRPWIIPPAGEMKHVTGPIREFNAILDYQKRFAGGEIVGAWTNPQTGNVNVIIDVFPEYIEDVRNGRIPKFVSPLLNIDSEDPTTGEIVDARIIHLQSVHSPGYDESIAKINGVCEGMLGKCMSELKVRGATKMLKKYQSGLTKVNLENFSNKRIVKGSATMSENNGSETTNEPITLETVNQKVDSLGEKFQSFEQKFDELATTIRGAASPSTVTIRKPETNKKESKADKVTIETEDNESLKAKYENLQKQFDSREKEIAAEKAKIAEQRRLELVKDIVSNEMKLQLVTPRKKDEKEKYYFELKTDDDKPADLSLLAKTLKEQAGKISGATSMFEIASMGNDSQEESFDYLKAMERVH